MINDDAIRRLSVVNIFKRWNAPTARDLCPRARFSMYSVGKTREMMILFRAALANTSTESDNRDGAGDTRACQQPRDLERYTRRAATPVVSKS